MDFCQSGGHNSSQTSRITGNLTTVQHIDKNNTSLWKICDGCFKKYAKVDPTMDILLFWANEISSTNKLPESLKDNPFKQSLLVQYIDKFLNLNMRIKFGSRFPIYLTDVNETEKKYFLQELGQQSVLSNAFLSDIKDLNERKSIPLKLWAGAISGAKSTRVTYNTGIGEKAYELSDRVLGFREVDKMTKENEIVRTGVEVAPIIELLVRDNNVISLEGSEDTSPIRKYIKKYSTLQSITSNDLQIKGKQEGGVKCF
jgi:hypothetical protein